MYIKFFKEENMAIQEKVLAFGNDIVVTGGSGGATLTDRTFNVASSVWEENQDSSTSTDYPYIAEINTQYYNNNSRPIWQMNGVGIIPTETEQQNIKLILEAVFNSSGVVLYATDEPSVNLVLEVKGE
jgi:hypothetical protein